MSHITVNGVSWCQTPLPSFNQMAEITEMAKLAGVLPICGHRNSEDAEVFAEILRQYGFTNVEVVEAPCRAYLDNDYYGED